MVLSGPELLDDADVLACSVHGEGGHLELELPVQQLGELGQGERSICWCERVEERGSAEVEQLGPETVCDRRRVRDQVLQRPASFKCNEVRALLWVRR